MVFESVINFSEKLKKSGSHRELIIDLFGPNSEELFENRRIRLLVHEDFYVLMRSVNCETFLRHLFLDTCFFRHLIFETLLWINDLFASHA